MRCLLEDTVFKATQIVDCVIEWVMLPQNSNRRDVWFRFAVAGGGEIVLKAYKTRTAATAGSTDFIASKTITCGGSEQTVTLTNNAGVAPDMTGLSITGTFKDSLSEIVVWGYTASPELVVCDNVRTILMEYVGSGKALADLGPSPDTDGSSHILVGKVPEGEDGPVVPMDPAFIYIVAEGPDLDDSMATGSLEYHVYRVTIQVYVETFGDAGDVFPSIQAWRECSEIVGSVDSIVSDECRAKYLIGRGMKRESREGPEVHPRKPTLAEGDVVLEAHLHAMWRDDTNPRL